MQTFELNDQPTDPNQDPHIPSELSAEPPPAPPIKQRGLRLDLRPHAADLLTFVLLFGILLVGSGLRAIGQNWDDYTHLHPDERFLTDVASRVGSAPLSFNMDVAEQVQRRQICYDRYPPLSESELSALSPIERDFQQRNIAKGGYFDAQCSDLNPNNLGFGLYVYGQFPLFVTRISAETIVGIEEAQCLNQAGDDESAQSACLFQTRTSPVTTYNGIHFVGRGVSAAADVLTILIIFLIGFKLFGRWQGLVAAALYAFAAFPIQQSHFWTVDAFTTTWVMLCIYAAVNVLDDENHRPARFSPLIWIAATLSLWALELEHLSGWDTAWSLGLYAAALGWVYGWAALAFDPHKSAPARLIFAPFGLLILALGFALGLVTPLGLVAALLLMLGLVAYCALGLHRMAAYGGTAVWLMAGGALWVYDGLAHYRNPSLIPLVIYAIIFTVGSLLASALYRAESRRARVNSILIFGAPLFLWGLLSVALGALSLWGLILALLAVSVISTATRYGYRDHVAFGIAFGAALASRVNVAPLVGVLGLAILIRAFPIFDRQLFISERYRLASWALMGLIIAGIVTLFTFRVLQPHAFDGLYIGRFHLGFIPGGLSERWAANIGEAQRLVSGAADIPPNHQWANRVPWMFPWQNMVLYGMGAAFGLLAWAGLAYALFRIIRARAGWTRLVLPAAWITVYFGWLGGNWVTTMRYFLPLYGALALFAGWLGVFMLQSAYRAYHNPAARSNRLSRLILLGASIAILLGTLSYTGLYGVAKANQFTYVLSRVGVSLWFQENVPGNLGLWVKRDDGGYVLQNMATGVVSQPPNIQYLSQGESLRVPITITTDYILDSVVLHRVLDPSPDPQPATLRARIQRRDGVGLAPVIVAERTVERVFSVGYGAFGDEYTFPFDDAEQPLTLPYFPQGLGLPPTYELELTLLSDGLLLLSRGVSDNILPSVFDHVTLNTRDVLTGAPYQIGLRFDTEDDNKNAPPYTFYMPGHRSQTIFEARATGEVDQLFIPHVANPLRNATPVTLRAELSTPSGEISYGQVRGTFIPDPSGRDALGPSASIRFDPPVKLQQGAMYTLMLSSDAPVQTLGSVVATEGPWDDPLPYKACQLPPNTPVSRDLASGFTTGGTCAGVELFGVHYFGIELYLVAEDNEQKRELMQQRLDQADYLSISSNRFYDTLSRIPYRWPMSLAYYDALFSGELGFELALEWTSYPRLGGLEWKNQVLPTDDLPAWLNEFEAEEAFHVYDSPAVFIFRKTENYSSERTAAVLNTSIRQYREAFGGNVYDPEPVNRNVITAPEASAAPTGLMMSATTAAAQRLGTWSEIFNINALINRNHPAAVVVWWALMMLLGWVAFPLLFVIFPALPDRGYAAAKFAGLMLVAWLAWVGGALHIGGAWSNYGILLGILLLAALSLSLILPRRRAFMDFLRVQWRHLLALEGLTLLLFLAFLFVRLKNPDLWHNSFGGEKPMDFAYFNAVLRSEVFPPLDPWFAGGYINYYYWGFVLMGAPTKLLGLMPALAYNLAIPTLFAMTGAGAFSIAYNLVAARPANSARSPLGNPWLAGIAALMLIAVLGNLDTIRLFTTEVAKVGGWAGPAAYDLTESRRIELIEQFREENNREPALDESLGILEQAERASVVDRLRHNGTQLRELGAGFATGIGRVLEGQPLQMATHRWYWAPTRVIGELPGGRGHNAINEMPYFTFLYGDLHAHMMAIPMMLFALLWLSAEVLGAGAGLRRGYEVGLALGVGGVTVGLLRATNTWDWPTYMILAVAGLTYVAWRTQAARKESLAQATPALHGYLKRFLDFRQALGLWPLLFTLPIGAGFYLLVWMARSLRYNAQLSAGQIPIACQNLNPALPTPALCAPYHEPSFSIAGLLIWAFGAFAGVIVLYMAAFVLSGARFDRDAFLAWLGRLALFGGVSFLAALPFTAYYAGEAGLKPWTSDRTPLWAYVDIHGLFLFILFSFLAWNSARILKRFHVSDLKGLSLPVLLVLIGAPLTLLAALLIGILAVPVMLITLPMIIWASGLFLIPGTSAAERVVYTLTVLALGLTTGVEIVVLNVDIGRQNMVFKFYMQAWLLFGISAGVAVAWLFDSLERWSSVLRLIWQTALALLVTVALMYPIMATQARWLDRFDANATGITLDGMAYMQHAVYGDNAIWFNTLGDYNMINWLNQNIEGTPTIIEAQTPEYRWGSRIAINTGLPTVIGWNWHQRQQRNVISLTQLVWNRSNNVAAFYDTPDVGIAWNLIQFYGIDYIIVGVQERVTYNDLSQNLAGGELVSGLSAGLSKFEVMRALGLLEVVYEAPVCVMGSARPAEDCPPQNIVQDRIYRVIPDAEYHAAQQGG